MDRRTWKWKTITQVFSFGAFINIVMDPSFHLPGDTFSSLISLLKFSIFPHWHRLFPKFVLRKWLEFSVKYSLSGSLSQAPKIIRSQARTAFRARTCQNIQLFIVVAVFFGLKIPFPFFWPHWVKFFSCLIFNSFPTHSILNPIANKSSLILWNLKWCAEKQAILCSILLMRNVFELIDRNLDKLLEQNDATVDTINHWRWNCKILIAFSINYTLN